MNKLWNVVLFLLLLIHVSLKAQEKENVLSLNECIRLARINNYDIKKSSY